MARTRGQKSQGFVRARDGLFGRREPASRSYRYLSLLIERDFGNRETGVVLGLVSPDDDAACASTLLMLAYCLRSELAAKVLIIDARFDAIERGVSGRLGLTGAPGFADLMAREDAGIAEYVQPTGVTEVDVVPAGEPGKITLAGWDRPRFAAILRDARRSYPFVLVQLGSVLADTRNLLVSAQLDVVMMVAVENKTLMKTLTESQELMLESGATDVRTIII